MLSRLQAAPGAGLLTRHVRLPDSAASPDGLDQVALGRARESADELLGHREATVSTHRLDFGLERKIWRRQLRKRLISPLWVIAVRYSGVLFSGPAKTRLRRSPSCSV